MTNRRRLNALLFAVVLAWLPGLMPDSPRVVSAQSPPPSTGGPVVLMGIDAEEQAGVGSHPKPGDYTLLLDTMLGQVSNGGSGILVIGAGKSVCANSPDYSKVFWDAVDVNITTAAVTYVNGAAAIAAQSLSGFKMIAVASSDIEIASGCGLTNDENNALASRKNDVATFVNGGGALLGFTATGLANPYGYLAPFGSFAFTTGVNYNNITPTSAGTAVGITDAAFDKCCWHDEFTAFPSFLSVLATNGGNTSTFPNPGTVGNAAAIGGTSVVVDEEKTATFTGGTTPQRVDFFQNTANPIAFLIALPGFTGNVTFRAELTTQQQLTDPANNRFASFPGAICGKIGPGGKCVNIATVGATPTINCSTAEPSDPTCVDGRFKWLQPAPYGNPQILHDRSAFCGTGDPQCDNYDENATVPGTFNPLIDPSTPNDPVIDWESGGISSWIVADLPPFLTVPGDIAAVATSPGGAVVTFNPFATTAASDFGVVARPLVTCASTPTSGLTSGSTFPIGTTTVTCSATSDTGLVTTKSFNVTVTNAPPSGLLLNSGFINENDSFTLTGSFTDPDGQTHTVSINWGDLSSPTVLSLAPGVLVFSAPHQYLDDNPTGTPSDTYTVGVTVTDAAGASATGSTSVVVTNVPPVITGVTGPVGPLALGSVATVSATFTDVGTQDTHTCTFSWDDGSSTGPGPFFVGGSCSASHTYTAAGVYTVTVTVTDDDGGSTTSTFEFVVIYDPSAGFVTGGGWINSPAGAYTPIPSLTGKANFGFVSKYQRGATVPTGQTQFQLHTAGFNFHSSVYEVLVVSGHKAQYRGSGTINGVGDYGFRLTAYDGQVSGGDGLDKFRIKIWDKVTNLVIYDNRLATPDDIDTADPQVIGGGSIVIHTGK